MNIKTKVCSLVIASIIAAMVISINPFVFAQSSSNQTGNNATYTKSNSTANNISRCSNSEETQLGAAIQSFLKGDENRTLMHMNEADKTLAGAAKTHLDAAISALQSGDTDKAKNYLQESMYACGVPDVL